MYKHTLSLVAVLILLSGCGSSNAPKSRMSQDRPNTLQPLSDNMGAIETSLRQAGFNAASDVVRLTNDTIAFTYYDTTGVKHFVVYDGKNGKILSNIAHFKGEEVIHNDDTKRDIISFKNGTVVKTNDYKHAQVDYSKTHYKPIKQINPRDLIEAQLPDNQHVTKFVYSPQKQAAAVLIESETGINGLYLYGLDSSSPVREQNVYPLLEAGDNIYNIRFPKSGEITYMVTNMGWKYFYRYDYFAKKLTKYKTIDPHEQQHNEDNYRYDPEQHSAVLNMSPKEAIRAQIDTDRRTMRDFIYTSDNHSDAAVVIDYVGGDGAIGLELYDIPKDGRAPYKVYDVEAPGHNAEWTEITNLKRIGGGKFTFTGRSRDANGYHTRNYTYYYLEHRYADNYTDSDQSLSPKERIRTQIENMDNRMFDFIYTSDNHSDAAVVIGHLGANGSKYLVLYDIPRDGGEPYKVYDVYPPEGTGAEWIEITNLKRIGGGKFTFTGRSRDESGYHTRNYTYHYLDHYYTNYNNSSNHASYSDNGDENTNYGHSMSTEESIRTQLSQHLPGYELTTWSKTYSGQGFLAVARYDIASVLIVFDNRDGRPVYEKYIKLQFLDDPRDKIMINPLEGGKVQILITDDYGSVFDQYEISYI